MTRDPREIAQRIREREFEIARKIVAESPILNSLSIVAQTTEVDRIYAILAAHYEPVPEPPASDELTELRRALKKHSRTMRCLVWKADERADVHPGRHKLGVHQELGKRTRSRS